MKLLDYSITHEVIYFINHNLFQYFLLIHNFILENICYKIINLKYTCIDIGIKFYIWYHWFFKQEHGNLVNRPCHVHINLGTHKNLTLVERTWSLVSSTDLCLSRTNIPQRDVTEHKIDHKTKMSKNCTKPWTFIIKNNKIIYWMILKSGTLIIHVLKNRIINHVT